MTQITYLKNWGNNFTIRPNNLLDREGAKARMASGKMITLVFGDPENAHFYLEIFNNINRIDVAWMRNGKDVDKYACVNAGLYEKYGRDEMFLNSFYRRQPETNDLESHTFFTDAYTDGDFPCYKTFNGVDVEWRSIAATFENCWLGPLPTFEELCDGTFVKRLPRIDPPPAELLDTYIPQDQRTKRTPKRPPRGVYPGPEKRLPDGIPDGPDGK